MKMKFEINSRAFWFDSDEFFDISIPLLFNGQQPNAYGAGKASAIAYESGGFIGDTRRGGSCNFEEYRLIDAGDAFIQQDADYFPIPFARGLRVTWEGTINELHFYQLQVRLYASGTTVRTFDPAKDMKEFEPEIRAAVAGLTQPSASTSRASP